MYHKSLLRHLAVIPLGGNNITKDITALKMEDREAELLKLKYASAYTEVAEMDAEMEASRTYPIDGERSIESKQLVDLVEARVEEIIQNVWHQIPVEYTNKLLSGIILTGGGSNMKNIELAFKKYTNVEKIRKANFVNLSIKSNIEDVKKRDTTLNTIISLMAKGDMNCAGKPIAHKGADLFGQTGENAPQAEPNGNHTQSSTQTGKNNHYEHNPQLREESVHDTLDESEFLLNHKNGHTEHGTVGGDERKEYA